ncbi:MAG: hypothetical protein HYW70_02020 [Candidatus Nealsonbacteria bacterium]|nr:hypothetical protein [Candidatus Nealsonbacteria bacterium]
MHKDRFAVAILLFTAAVFISFAYKEIRTETPVRLEVESLASQRINDNIKVIESAPVFKARLSNEIVFYSAEEFIKRLPKNSEIYSQWIKTGYFANGTVASLHRQYRVFDFPTSTNYIYQDEYKIGKYIAVKNDLKTVYFLYDNLEIVSTAFIVFVLMGCVMVALSAAPSVEDQKKQLSS